MRAACPIPYFLEEALRKKKKEKKKKENQLDV